MDVPRAVRRAQLAAYVQAMLGIVLGIFLLVFAFVAKFQGMVVNHVLLTPDELQRQYVESGVFWVVLGLALIFPAFLIGQLSRGGRFGVTALSSIMIGLCLIGVGANPIVDLMVVALGVVVLYGLWFNRDARAAFAG